MVDSIGAFLRVSGSANINVLPRPSSDPVNSGIVTGLRTVSDLVELSATAQLLLQLQARNVTLEQTRNIVVDATPDSQVDARVDLSGAELAGRDLSGLDLRRAILRFADLRNTNLSGTNLTGVSFFSADVTGALFFGADLGGASFAGAINLRSEQLLGARGDENTVLPLGVRFGIQQPVKTFPVIRI